MTLAAKDQRLTLRKLDALLRAGRKEEAAVATAIARYESNYDSDLVHPRSKAAGAWQLHWTVLAHYHKEHKKQGAAAAKKWAKGPGAKLALEPHKAHVVFAWYWRWLDGRPYLPDGFVWRAWAYVSGPGRVKRVLRLHPYTGGGFAKYTESLGEKYRKGHKTMEARIKALKAGDKKARALASRLMPLREGKRRYARLTAKRYTLAKRTALRAPEKLRDDFAALLAQLTVFRPRLRRDPALLPSDRKLLTHAAKRRGDRVDDFASGWSRRWRKRGGVKRSKPQRVALRTEEVAKEAAQAGEDAWRWTTEAARDILKAGEDALDVGKGIAKWGMYGAVALGALFLLVVLK